VTNLICTCIDLYVQVRVLVKQIIGRPMEGMAEPF